MIKRILYAIFGIPIALVLGFALINLISAFLGGEITVAQWVADYRVLLGIGLAIGFFAILKPRRRKRSK